MQIRDSLFFSRLVVSLRSESAAADLESLRAMFADPHFDEQRDILNPLGDEPIDVSAAPTLELPATLTFPDEFVQLTVSRTDPLLQLIAQAGGAAGRPAVHTHRQVPPRHRGAGRPTAHDRRQVPSRVEPVARKTAGSARSARSPSTRDTTVT